MDLIINILAILIGAFGFILLFGGFINKNLGLILAGLTCSLGALLSYKFENIIPIIIAIVVLFILRKLGFDPSTPNKISDKDLVNMAMPNGWKQRSMEEVREGIRASANKNGSRIEIRFISVVIPIAIIEDKCKEIGGLKGVLEVNEKWVGKKIKYNKFLYKDGAMSPDDIEPIIEFWKKNGLKPIEERDGKKYWKDLCVIDQFSGPTLPCKWIDYDLKTFTASIKN